MLKSNSEVVFLRQINNNKMANQIIPKGTTLKFIKIGAKDFVLTPLGQTSFANPTTPLNQGGYSITVDSEWEVEYNPSNKATDSSRPINVFCEYIGGRPTGR